MYSGFCLWMIILPLIPASDDHTPRTSDHCALKSASTGLAMPMKYMYMSRPLRSRPRWTG